MLVLSKLPALTLLLFSALVFVSTQNTFHTPPRFNILSPDGAPPEPSKEMVQKLLMQAKSTKDRDSQYFLALLYYYGQTLSKNEMEARKMFQLAAEQGHEAASVNLAVLMLNGIGWFTFCTCST